MNEKQLDEELELDLLELFHVLLNNWLLILVTTILTTTIAILATIFLIEPQYVSSAMLYNVNTTATDTSLSDIQIGTQLSQDFIIIAKSNPVLDSAAEDVLRIANVELTREEISSMVTVTNATNTRILVISATTNDPNLSATVANAVTTEAAKQVAYIMNSDRPTTVESVEVNDIPVSPSKSVNAAIGFFLGLLISIGFVFLKFVLNNKIVTPTDIESIGLTNLSVIPLDKATK